LLIEHQKQLIKRWIRRRCTRNQPNSIYRPITKNCALTGLYS